jgi:hypothetical protein
MRPQSPLASPADAIGSPSAALMPPTEAPLDLSHRDGNYLDGARNYRLHVAPRIPAKNFWSVVVYGALSRSALQNGQPLPSVSVYSNPKLNADESVDIAFGPGEPKDKGNWIRRFRGKGWFPSSASTARRRSTSTRRGSSRTSWRCNDASCPWETPVLAFSKPVT